MEKEDKKLFEMVLQDDKEEGLYALSMVEKPAMKSHWVALSDHKKQVKFATMDEEKRVVMGAVLIPDMPVYRNWNGGLYIYFSENTIRDTHELAMRKGLTTFTLDHGKVAPNIHLFETWMVEDSKKDKSAIYGMEFSKGTWVVSLKINNTEVWNDYIKTGEVTGFSIEGLFKMKDEPDDTMTDEEFIDEVKKLLNVV